MSAGPRGKEIYVSSKTKQRLFWILEIEQLVPIKGDISVTKHLTVDEIADRMLSEAIEAKYPNIKTLEKRLDALEGQLISELLTPTTEK